MAEADPFEPTLTARLGMRGARSGATPTSIALKAYQFRVRIAAHYAGPEFATTQPLVRLRTGRLLRTAMDLCHRIHTGFHYDKEATTVVTPVAEVLESRRGVCQDFAHFMIACLAVAGLAARYVSGYLRSGGIGSEASHAGFRSSAPVSAGWT